MEISYVRDTQNYIIKIAYFNIFGIHKNIMELSFLRASQKYHGNCTCLGDKQKDHGNFISLGNRDTQNYQRNIMDLFILGLYIQHAHGNMKEISRKSYGY